MQNFVILMNEFCDIYEKNSYWPKLDDTVAIFVTGFFLHRKSAAV